MDIFAQQLAWTESLSNNSGCAANTYQFACGSVAYFAPDAPDFQEAGVRQGDRLGYEGAGTAGRIQNELVKGVGDDFSHHGACQPAWCVIFSQMTALIWRNHCLVQDSGNIVGGLLPVEPAYSAGQCLEQSVNDSKLIPELYH